MDYRLLLHHNIPSSPVVHGCARARVLGSARRALFHPMFCCFHQHKIITMSISRYSLGMPAMMRSKRDITIFGDWLGSLAYSGEPQATCRHMDLRRNRVRQESALRTAVLAAVSTGAYWRAQVSLCFFISPPKKGEGGHPRFFSDNYGLSLCEPWLSWHESLACRSLRSAESQIADANRSCIR